MSFFDFLFCNGCRAAPKMDITADVDITSLEILSISDEIISIFLETKISLNCTNFQPKDCLYVYNNPGKTTIKFPTLAGKDFLEQNKIRLDLDGGYLILNKSELKIRPGIYNILYLRSNGLNENNEEVKEWKVLGSSPAFKLAVMNEEPHSNRKTQKEQSMKSTESSEKPIKTQKTPQKMLDHSQSYTKLKTELLEQQNLDETFLPLKPKKINLDCYLNNPIASKFNVAKKKEKKVDKENNNPNFNVFS